MMNKLFKKGVALLGGVMMLLNVALPGFTYAEEATAPFTVTMSASEETDNKVTVEVKYPADINADLIGKKWIDAEIVPEQAIPAGTEVTIKYTLSNSEGEGPVGPVVSHRFNEEVPAGVSLRGSALMNQSERTQLNAAHKGATEKFEITFQIPGQEKEGIIKLKVKSALYDAENVNPGEGTILGEKDFSVNIPLSEVAKKKQAVDAITLMVDAKQELSPTEVNTISYAGENGTNSLGWKESLPAGLEMKECTLVGEDNISYNRHGEQAKDNGESGSNNPMYFAGCGGLFGGAYHSYRFKDQVYTLTVDFGDEVKKVYKFKFVRLADLEWKTDYDPSKSTNPDIKNFITARQGTPFVNIKNKDDAKLSNLLGFLYTINAPNLDLSEGNNVGYTITLGDKVIAYGALRKEQPIAGMFQWSFRDWSTSAAYTAEETKYDADNFYHDGPAGNTLDDVEGSNETILKAGDKVTILVKIKLADGKEASITQDYVITAQDVINAQYGVEKLTLTLKDGDVELGKQTVLSGTAAEKPADPKKENFTFKGWFTDAGLKTAFDFATKLDKDTTLYAKWEAVKPSSSGSSSGGGGGGSSYSPSKKTTTNTAQTTTPKTSDTLKAEDNKSLEALTKTFVEANKADASKLEAFAQVLASVKQSSEAQELKDAYTYAYLRGITTQPSIEKAQLQRGLTRAEMAKMMSVFAMNVLGKKVVKTDSVQYADVEGMEGDLPGFIQLAYQLQIMGIDAKGNAIPHFNPQGEVSRAEFATVLSRVLFGDKYNQAGADFASKHLEALKAVGVLKSTQSDLKELRGWVMLMLQRAEGVK